MERKIQSEEEMLHTKIKLRLASDDNFLKASGGHADSSLT